MPRIFTITSQANVQVPYGIHPGLLRLFARRGKRVCVPQMVAVASSDPGIFVVEGTGKGQSHIHTASADGIQLQANVESPATPGLVIDCTGLGEVLPPLVAGAAAPSDVLRTTSSALFMTIGGVDAPVAFIGVTPGSMGLSQVNVTIPPSVSPGYKVPMTISIAVDQSRPVMFAVQ